MFFNEKFSSIISKLEKEFESHQLVDSIQKFMQQNWKWSIYISTTYIAIIFLIKYLMRTRQRYELRLPLIIWNIFLALFSISGTIHVLPDFIQDLMNKNIKSTICSNDFVYGSTGFWLYMFVLSKLPELIDTLFVVLRKQELIFLHWYHHATVLMYCWFSYNEFASTGRWFMTMNYLVHSIMYSYYAFKAMKFKVPKFVSQLITISQLLQMAAGCFVNLTAYWTKLENEVECNVSSDNIKYSLLMYFSYFILFAYFFIRAYCFKEKTMKNKKID